MTLRFDVYCLFAGISVIPSMECRVDFVPDMLVHGRRKRRIMVITVITRQPVRAEMEDSRKIHYSYGETIFQNNITEMYPQLK